MGDLRQEASSVPVFLRCQTCDLYKSVFRNKAAVGRRDFFRREQAESDLVPVFVSLYAEQAVFFDFFCEIYQDFLSLVLNVKYGGSASAVPPFAVISA